MFYNMIFQLDLNRCLWGIGQVAALSMDNSFLWGNMCMNYTNTRYKNGERELRTLSLGWSTDQGNMVLVKLVNHIHSLLGISDKTPRN